MVYTFTTHNEGEMNGFTTAHPYYFVEGQKKVKEWILGLKVTDELFCSGVLPRGVDHIKGQSYDTVFKKVKYKFEYFNDMEVSELIDKHLDALLIEVTSIKDSLEHDRATRCTHDGKKSSSTPKTIELRKSDDDASKTRTKLMEERDAALDEVAALRKELKKYTNDDDL